MRIGAGGGQLCVLADVSGCGGANRHPRRDNYSTRADKQPRGPRQPQIDCGKQKTERHAKARGNAAPARHGHPQAASARRQWFLPR